MDESRDGPSVLEACDMDEAVDTHRDSSGQAPRAGVGRVSGDGESLRGGGRLRWLSLAVAMSRGPGGSHRLSMVLYMNDVPAWANTKGRVARKRRLSLS